MIGKLMSLASVGSAYASVTALQRFLSHIASVIPLMIFSAIMTSALAISGLYAFYVVLVQHGLESGAALTIVIALGASLTLIVIGLAVSRLRMLRDLQHSFPREEIPVFSKASNVIQAFITGFTEQPQKR